MLHTKARTTVYPQSSVNRTPVPDDRVLWSVPFPEYKPVNYTSPHVLSQPVWADYDIRNKECAVAYSFNAIDGKVDRRSHMGKYELIDGVPRNPCGRTGMQGRGLLGKWGPNHAADPIVTRWMMAKKKKVLKEEKPVLEFVAIRRKDTGEWALPGGMVDPGESVPDTLKREFGEEALNTIDASSKEKKKIKEKIDRIFKDGLLIYKGYVDDHRNTDNAWLETVAVNFHDDSGKLFHKIKLSAGDDAADVRWMEVDRNTKLYASHIHFLEMVCNQRGAFF